MGMWVMGGEERGRREDILFYSDGTEDGMWRRMGEGKEVPINAPRREGIGESVGENNDRIRKDGRSKTAEQG